MDQRNDGLWSRKDYTAPLDYIIDNPIYEYDISKANISVLLDAGRITQQYYQTLFSMPKQLREVTIGKLILKDSSISDCLKQGIEDARKSLFSILNLNESNVLAIKNDAVFVIKTDIMDYPSSVQVSPNVVFLNKNIYRSYYKINQKQMFYAYDPITGLEGLDIKGLGDYSINLHKNYLIGWMMNLFYIAITGGCKAALQSCNEFYDSYVKKQLPIEFYRRFDSNAQFDLIHSLSDWGTFRADYLISAPAEDSIDISYNANIINSLMKIYLAELLK